MPLCLLKMIRVCPTGSVERALQPKIESPPQTPKMCVCIEGRTVVLSGPQFRLVVRLIIPSAL